MASASSSAKSPIIESLNARRIFETLSKTEKLYAHHLSRAAWNGARIIMDQVSAESTSIFDLIMELHNVSEGDWTEYGEDQGVEEVHVVKFLEYAAIFLHNIGNYFGQGDQKFIPQLPEPEFRKLASGSAIAKKIYERISDAMYSTMPLCLGYPSETGQAQSRYYISSGDAEPFTKDEISSISQILQDRGIHQENTEFVKKLSRADNGYSFTVFQASIDLPEAPILLSSTMREGKEFTVVLLKANHRKQLEKINDELTAALAYCANDRQKLVLQKLIESFKTGDMEAYKESQRHWVKDIQPAVENIFGFVEPYRDPAGVRAEFEGLVGLVDKDETRTLTALAENSARFIRLLPWTKGFTDNDGKGPFEKELFEAPDFTSLHTLAYCSSIIFPGINLPNFNDIRQETGFKNVMIANSMNPPGRDSGADHSLPQEAIRVDPSLESEYIKHYQATFYLWVVFHELLGHGTGKLLTENSDGSFNFDKENPPINPVDGKPVSSWYKPGETWTGLFGDIATSVDECRCEVVGALLVRFPGVVGFFGYTDETHTTPKDMELNIYLQLGCAGLRALNNYIVEDKKWGQAHSRAHFAIMRILLQAGDDFLVIKENAQEQTLTVYVDQTKTKTHGIPALSDFLLKLHMFRSTANVKECREYYEELTEPSEQFLRWRHIIIANAAPPKLFVQDNTIINSDGEVVLLGYSPTLEDLVDSWVDRNI
ncbi:hypothetical protein H072_992 [Dactylellina haptotyla CBS 200.50]|uniref:Dipeptidyl peptidase 3 n=1 Tax=Dactylellina haptotyla (strain CBS 200.50) TaxID=1284197 RepID=S8AVN0_DACHA|nr:hypothetical protein H072_992 [Dactylellina haptotyla CBS 200.50]